MPPEDAWIARDEGECPWKTHESPAMRAEVAGTGEDINTTCQFRLCNAPKQMWTRFCPLTGDISIHHTVHTHFTYTTD